MDLSDTLKTSKTLFLEARNFGDAIIKNTIISQYGAGHPDEQIDVWTKRQFMDIFSRNERIHKVYLAGFPIAGVKSWNVIDLIKKIWALRRKRYDLAVDTVGDFRERFLLWLIHPKRLVSIEREEGSPFNRLIRRGLSFLIEPVNVGREMVNIYDQLSFLLESLGVPREIGVLHDQQVLKDNKVVGIHPFASQVCRMWSWEKWNELYAGLLARGYGVCFFCSPKERQMLEKYIKIHGDTRIVAGSLQGFLKELQQVDLLVCLDSFAVHASCSLGVRSIMLNGANDFRIWQTPLTQVVTGTHDCKYWPCYNKPRCTEYRCIRSIKSDDVIVLVCKLLL